MDQFCYEVETIHEGRATDSATLLSPALEGEPRYASFHVNDSDNDAYTHNDFPQGEESSIRSTSSLRGSKPIPIIGLMAQLIMFIGTVFFVIWTSVAHQTVPHLMADLYLEYPQSTATVLTLIGSLLSLINTKLFADAVRLAINVSLKNKGMSLYTLHAVSSVASRSPLFDLDSGRIQWAVISLVYFSLFTIQTSAWSTLITPRPMLMQQLGSFKDLDLNMINIDGFSPGIQAFESGIAAAQAVASNTTQLLVYSNLIFNGTSCGILPVPSPGLHLNNWTQIEAHQQGLTADVFCEVIRKPDPTFNVSEETGYIFNTEYRKITLSCNGTSDSSGALNNTLDQVNIIPAATASSYLFFTVCPYMQLDAPRNTFTLYMQNLIYDTGVSNMICSIQPRLLNVTVTYENTGIVTINSTTEILIDLPVNTSSVAQSLISAVSIHLLLTQSSGSNSVVDTLYGLTSINSGAVNMSWSQIEVDFSLLMAAYIQGVIED